MTITFTIDFPAIEITALHLGADPFRLSWTGVNSGSQRVGYRRSDVGGSSGAWEIGSDGLAVDELSGTKQAGECGGSHSSHCRYGGSI